jgi:hypothetical protein
LRSIGLFVVAAWVDVVIPPDRLDAVQPATCAQSLVDHCEGSAIG